MDEITRRALEAFRQAESRRNPQAQMLVAFEVLRKAVEIC
jgi:hypothetical protein